MNFLDQLTAESRLLNILHDNLPAEIKTSTLYSSVASYLQEYTSFNNFSAEDAITAYTRYITVYNKHCKQFSKTGKYPLASGDADFELSREAYDIILLLSILFTPHRFCIMQLLQQESKPAGNVLYIGLGSGIEVGLTKANYNYAEGYDLSINKFLFHHFPQVNFHIELYTGQKAAYYDAICLIELLEHLEEPYHLLEICKNSLKEGGKIFLTTATDIPQFDHLYNFPKDHTEFENKVQQLGLHICLCKDIPHHYLSINLEPSNRFYTLQKQ